MQDNESAASVAFCRTAWNKGKLVGASLSAAARHYGIAARVVFRWKQELAATTPTFVTVQITDAAAQSGAALPVEDAVS